jgi:hypothetical protein
MARSIVVLVAAVATLALAACSGAGNQDLFESASEQSDTASTLPTPSNGTSGTPGTGAPSTPPGTGKDPGTTQPTPEPAADECTPEKEPNDEASKATPFKTGLCGKIDSSNDVDYGSFVVPANARSITWDHTESARVSYRFYVAGVPVPALDDETLQVVPGATYTVQIKSGSTSGGNRPTYELTVDIQ